MTEILRSLGNLFIQTIPTIIFVFLLLLVLERWFFRPLFVVLDRRKELTDGALARAKEHVADAETKTRQYEAAWQLGRHEIYRLREEGRRSALAQREGVLKKAREQAQAQLAQAQAELARQMETVKGDLKKACQSLALTIAETLLGEGRGPDRERGAGL